jgi:hypothetical protein
VGKPSKSEDSDTQGRRGAEYFSSEDFQRNCETVTLSVVLQQYSTSTQYRAAQSDKVRDVSKLQFLQYSSYWNRSFDSDIDDRFIIRLGNSIRSTGSTKTVSAICLPSKPEVSRQQHYSTGTTGRSPSTSASPSKRPEALLSGFQQRSEHSSVRSIRAFFRSTCPSKDSTPKPF